MRNELPITRRRTTTRGTSIRLAAVLAAVLLAPCGRAHAAYISIDAGQNATSILGGDFDSLFASNTLFTTPVPELASLLLLGTGAAATLVARRRARHLAAPPARNG